MKAAPPLRFPKRVYTENEVEEARRLVQSGYKHRLMLKGTLSFKEKVRAALEHVKTAGFYGFLRRYIRQIVEIDGFSQLREADVALWVNLHLLEDPIDAAGFFIQKASQMQEFLEGQLYYGGKAEARSVEKRVGFLKTLKHSSKDARVKTECERLLKQWAESKFL